MNETTKNQPAQHQAAIPSAKPKLGLKHHINKNRHLSAWIAAIAIVLIAAAGIIYFYTVANKIYIEKAEISADAIGLAPQNAGTLEEVMVNVGDQVPANTVVARVGTELIKTSVAGVLIDVKKDIGKTFNRGEAVATIVQAGDLKVVGRLAEDKGLKDVQAGQAAVFKVDAFGSKKYYGIVDEVSPTSRESGVAFNISDKRETKEFDIKIRFNNDAYPELKNGMSAKIWIYKNAPQQ